MQWMNLYFIIALSIFTYFGSQLHNTEPRPTKKVPSESPDHGLSEYTLKLDLSLNTASAEAIESES